LKKFDKNQGNVVIRKSIKTRKSKSKGKNISEKKSLLNRIKENADKKSKSKVNHIKNLKKDFKQVI
jgi:hypothetical protein